MFTVFACWQGLKQPWFSSLVSDKISLNQPVKKLQITSAFKSLAPKQTQKNNCQTRQKNWERRAKTGRGGIGKQNRGQGDNGSGGDHAEKNGYSAAAPAKAVIMTKNTSGGQSSSGSEGSIPRTQNKEVAPVSNSIPLGSCLRRALFSFACNAAATYNIWTPRPTRYRTKGIMVSAPSVSVRK